MLQRTAGVSVPDPALLVAAMLEREAKVAAGVVGPGTARLRLLYGCATSCCCWSSRVAAAVRCGALLLCLPLLLLLLRLCCVASGGDALLTLRLLWSQAAAGLVQRSMLPPLVADSEVVLLRWRPLGAAVAVVACG